MKALEEKLKRKFTKEWKFEQRKIKIKQKRSEFLKRLKMENEDKVPQKILDLIIKDKDWLRAWYTTESEYSPLEFIQAFLFLILYYFFFGYFINILLWCYNESDQPKYMARLHGFLGLFRSRSKPWKIGSINMPRIDGLVIFN